ncbi:radical SAM protein [Candidatus Woesearchaeota archaeon]|jgi:threonylcarbamoyladenosine tRNA methylthiotransferase CDKAL1|nr:radical SAM protein [Candidatus Woesearchaeota archaeon]MBT6052498.1 radical SAM protein [Candidatus Scalindua sp.]
MKRVYLFNTGCIRRALDTTRVYHYLTKNGWSFTNNISVAQLIVVSTCGAVQKTEDLSKIALKNIAEKMSKDASLIVTGCLPSINPQVLHNIPGVDKSFFVPTRELDSLDEILKSEVRMRNIPEANLVTNEIGLLDYVLAYRFFRHSFFLNIYKKMSSSRIFLKSIILLSRNYNFIRRKIGLPAEGKIVPYYNLVIAEGCAFNCAFCCIKFATKKVKSKPIKNIVEEFKRGLSKEYKIFQLVCEDVGCYGIDIGLSFPELLKQLLSINGNYKLIILDLGGYWLVKYYKELLPLLVANPDKLREFYVSIQSGSKDILKAMRRPDKIDRVIATLKDMKNRLPHLIIRTTVIVGFPGETDEDFEKTIMALREVEFSAVEINKYEDRPGTESSRMDNKIPADVIDRRVKELAMRIPAASASRRA